MKISSHLVEFQLDRKFEFFAFEYGVNSGNGLLTDLSYFLFDVILVVLDDSRRSIFGIDFFGVEDLQGSPGCSSGVDFAFVGSGEELDLFLLDGELLILVDLDDVSHILDHVLVSLCLLGYFGEVNHLLDLSIHLLLFQMHCHCKRRSENQEKFLRQEQTIVLLQELIEKEKYAHLEEIRVISQKLEDYSRQTERKIRDYEETVLKLGKKLDHYKEKNMNQNEKLKETSNTIKILMEKKVNVEAQLLRMRDTLQKQRQKGVQSSRYISQMKQIVSLQEIQNKELHRQVERLNQEIGYLHKQISNYSQVRDKFSNIQSISQEQYQKEIALLKSSLQSQFCKKTNDIFKGMTVKSVLEEKHLNTLEEYKRVNAQEEELKKLAHFIDYGESYFELENSQLHLFESKKIFKFIATILNSLRSTESALEKQEQTNSQLASDLRQRLAHYEAEISQISQRQTHNKETQTNQSTTISEVINTNTNLRVKIYEVTKIIQFFSKFAVYLFNTLAVQSTKARYFHFTEARTFKKERPNRFRLRSVCYSILFLQILKKNLNKHKRILPDQKLDRPNLYKYIKNDYLANLLFTFSLRQKRKITTKNHKIQELINDKSQLNPQQKIIQILNQQNLNQGINPFDYSQIFARFIYHSQKSSA